MLTSARSVSKYFGASAHGLAPAPQVKVLAPVTMPFSIGVCDTLNWANYLDQQALAAGVNPASYTRRMYLVPKTGCTPNINGIGFEGDSRSWVFTCGARTMAHELGHNLGMSHSNANGVEYGDPTDVMGATQIQSDTQMFELNAPHRHQLQWLGNGRVLDVGASGDYGVSALERDDIAGPQVLRVQKEPGTWVYLSYREPLGTFDNNLIVPMTTSVHLFSGGGPTDLQATLPDGQAFDLPGVLHARQLSHATGRACVHVDVAHPVAGAVAPGCVAPPVCVPSATTACALNGRFALDVTYRRPGGSLSGTAQAAAPYSDNTSLFWFFSSSNVELVVKVLDGQASNGKFWVFHGGLTDLEYTLTVRDTWTNVTETYVKPAGSFCGGSDVVFGNPGLGGGVPGSPLAATPSSVAPTVASCVPGANTLCLQGGRVRVQVDWTASGSSGIGVAQPLAGGESGLFSFFNAANVELIVKVLDGRAINGHFWIFTGALSNVAYSVTVTDLPTGHVVTLVNPAGNLCGSALTDQL